MIDILYEDAGAWVFVKPAGLASQPGEGLGKTLVEALEEQTGIRPFLVHRLDRDTHGVMCAAKTKAAAAALSALLAGSGASKEYRAVCRGRPEPAAGTIDADLDTKAGARKAITRYATLEGFGTESLLSISLGTGRMHQIRRHLASIGCPIVGDDKHGDFAYNREARKRFGARKLMLAAVRLELPGRGAFEAPMPEHMQKLLGALRGREG